MPRGSLAAECPTQVHVCMQPLSAVLALQARPGCSCWSGDKHCLRPVRGVSAWWWSMQGWVDQFAQSRPSAMLRRM